MTTPNQAAYFRYKVHNTKQCTYQQVPHHQHHCCFHCCHHHLLPHLPVHQGEHPHLLLTDVILMNKQSCSFYEQARMEGSWLYSQVNINNNIFSSRWQFWQTNILYLKVTITKIYMVCKESEYSIIYIYIYKRFFTLLSKITLQSITKLKGMNSFLTHYRVVPLKIISQVFLMMIIY